MLNLDEKYVRIVRQGISHRDNLADLNDMTDRGPHPLKPWTAKKTVSTMQLIRDHQIRDIETFVNLFQLRSKKRLEQLTWDVFHHQMPYFGYAKYNIEQIFKYTWCCIVLNSLQGHCTETAFDRWAYAHDLYVRIPLIELDAVFHTDRVQFDPITTKITHFISIKPQSFSKNYQQYHDVFAGLNFLSQRYQRPWVIYFAVNDGFQALTQQDLSHDFQNQLQQEIYTQNTILIHRLDQHLQK